MEIKPLTSKTKSLDLHGEVTAMVEALVLEYINDAIMSNENPIRIIHGKSTDKLKNEVHRILKKDKRVDHYYINNWNIGETIVFLTENAQK